MKFEIDDVVQINGFLFLVTGVIHDNERIFVDRGKGEVEYKFSEVEDQWQKV